MAMENIQENEHHYSDERDDRVKETAEVFTPGLLVDNMLNSLDVDWNNPTQDKKFIDPTCGSGNFLVVLAERGIPLCNIYGVDLMQDNIDITKRRLTEIFLKKRMSQEDIDFHLDRNIICEDALTYHYEFWWYDEAEYNARKSREQAELLFKEKIKKNEITEDLTDFDDF
jgi:2-polyprenyl-3-methyl-5-hydroxy-6-metoxy-1,4-benzoquinol methylase